MTECYANDPHNQWLHCLQKRHGVPKSHHSSKYHPCYHHIL